jgi:superfamily II DNA or RNA helicase
MEQARAATASEEVDWQPLPGHAVRVRGREAAVTGVESCPGGGSPLVEVVYTDGEEPAGERLLWGLECRGEEGPQEGSRLRVGPPARLVPFRAAVRAAGWQVPAVGLLAPGLPLAPLAAAARIREHQLVPLVKALSMPRVRLLLADGVGLGKTVEAGLIASELVARRRVRRILVLCPPGLRDQWQRELSSRFGLSFVVLGTPEARAMGGVEEAFASLPRIIVSPHWLARPENLAAFRRVAEQGCDGGCRVDLLIVDEAHHFLPRPRGGDTELVSMLREVVPWSEHRLFLSATPHDGFRMSFTGLLEILDPLSFRRTSAPTAAERQRMREVVIRRLRRDLVDDRRGIPPRKTVAWPVTLSAAEGLLFAALRQATAFLRRCGPRRQRCVSIMAEVLAKRLLSSVRAFSGSFRAFERGLRSGVMPAAIRGPLPDRDEEPPWLAAAEKLGAFLAANHPPAVARFEEVSAALAEVEAGEDGPQDSRIERLGDWVEAHLRQGDSWLEGEKVLVFTTFVVTAEAVFDRLEKRWPGTCGAFGLLTGASGEAARRTLLDRFVDRKSELRVLVTTDVAAEGLNLQDAARYVFHQDVPWNPAVLDQRTGRVDRIGQLRAVSSIHFVSRQSQELRLLSRVVRKAEAMEQDLGGLGELIESRVRRVVAGVAPERQLFPPPANPTTVEPPVCAVASVPGLVEELRAEASRRQLSPEAVREAFIEALTGDGSEIRPAGAPGTWQLQGPGTSAPFRLSGGAPLVFDSGFLPDGERLRTSALVGPGMPLFSWMCARLARLRARSLLWTAVAGGPFGEAQAAVLLFLTLWAENRLREPVAGAGDLLLLRMTPERGGWGPGRVQTGSDPEVRHLADELLRPGIDGRWVAGDPAVAGSVLAAALPCLPELVERRRGVLSRTVEVSLAHAGKEAARELSRAHAQRERELRRAADSAARKRLERHVEELDRDLSCRGFLFEELATGVRRRRDEACAELAERERRSLELQAVSREEERRMAARLPLRYSLAWQPALRLDALAILLRPGGMP